MTAAIEVRDLGKRYTLTHQPRGGYTALRDVLAEQARTLLGAPRRWLRREPPPQDPGQEPFWALKGVNFSIQPGESVGIIGRNGAGKSTLLKLLSRITEPTTGRIALRGRVSSLLEVGTGFHPELTGRENIFLNGVILGMSRAEVARKFDEVVAFAEIEQFLDTPVKRYSSGMYVRLAFAVAAHLEPQVLLVDEVLAVGDAGFQKKCLGKLEDVAKEGRTVVFVSHQMAMINALCQRAIMLNGGKLVEDGPTEAVLSRYLTSVQAATKVAHGADFPQRSDVRAQILSAKIIKTGGMGLPQFDVFDVLSLQIQYEIRATTEGAAVMAIMKRNSDILFVSFDTDCQPDLLKRRTPGKYAASLPLPSPLKAGHYVIDLGLGVLNGSGIDNRKDALAFEIEEISFDSSMRSCSLTRPGIIATHLPWRTVPLRPGQQGFDNGKE